MSAEPVEPTTEAFHLGPGIRRDERMSLTAPYSTVTDFARFRGWSTSAPFSTATW